MMQAQLERSRAETQGIREMKMKVEGILEGLSQAKLAEEKEKEKEENGEDVVEGRDVREVLEGEFGWRMLDESLWASRTEDISAYRRVVRYPGDHTISSNFEREKETPSIPRKTIAF
jgi:hypothetical protein